MLPAYNEGLHNVALECGGSVPIHMEYVTGQKDIILRNTDVKLNCRSRMNDLELFYRLNSCEFGKV